MQTRTAAATAAANVAAVLPLRQVGPGSGACWSPCRCLPGEPQRQYAAGCAAGQVREGERGAGCVCMCVLY